MQPLQTQLLAAAMDVCKEGGLVCYSTCSLNPVEDEVGEANVQVALPNFGPLAPRVPAPPLAPRVPAPPGSWAAAIDLTGLNID